MGEHRHSKAFEFSQTAAIGKSQRCDNGELEIGQFIRELVFFQNLGIAPALRPVKLDDDGGRIDYSDLVNPVLVAVQGEDARVSLKAEALDGREDLLGSEATIGMLRVGHGLRSGASGISGELFRVNYFEGVIPEDLLRNLSSRLYRRPAKPETS